MVYIDFTSIGWTAEDWLAKTASIGWKCRASDTWSRLCTHYGIEEEDIRVFVDRLGELI